MPLSGEGEGGPGQSPPQSFDYGRPPPGSRPGGRGREGGEGGEAHMHYPPDGEGASPGVWACHTGLGL
jgi:hypothetical protein